MKIQKSFFLFLLLLSIGSNAQEWKKYPYTPTGSLISFSKDEKNTSTVNIDTSDFKPGLYFLKLRSDQKTMQTKFLVE